MVDIEAPRKRHDQYRIDELLDMNGREREAFPEERFRQAVVDAAGSPEITQHITKPVTGDFATSTLGRVRRHAGREEATFWRSLDDLRRGRRQRSVLQGLVVTTAGLVFLAIFGLVLLALWRLILAVVLIAGIAVAGLLTYAFRAEIGDRVGPWWAERRLPGWTDLWRGDDSTAVQTDLKQWQTALYEGFLPYLREEIAATATGAPFRRRIGSAPGLRQPFDTRFHVVTDTGRRLARLLADMDGGSVALAGARGTGKTNLIEAIVDGYYGEVVPGMAVIMPAPVRYEPRDFVLQLYATACEKIITVATGPRRPGSHPELAGLARVARSSLHHIRHLQTRTNQVGGAIRGINIASSTSQARQALTYPEIVDDFRRFLERVATALSSEGAVPTITVPVLIGIDELDRMGSADNARTFLNEVKGIFSVRGCRFVVSIADETLQTFELAGTPLDVVVDRAFDEVLHVDYIDLDTVRRLLVRRVSPPFDDSYVALCYCLSGGIARDAVRAARTIAGIGHSEAAAAGQGADTLSSILGEVVAHEMQTAVRWARNVLLRCDVEPHATQAIGWLDPWWDLASTDCAELRELLTQTATQWPSDGLPDVVLEIWERLLAITWFLITLLDVFDQGDASEARLAGPAVGALTTLARSRRVLRSNRRLARALLDRFRAEWGLERIA